MRRITVPTFLTNRTFLTTLFLGMVIATPALADEKPTETKAVKPLSIAGTFEPVVSHELKADTDKIANLEIRKIAAHGLTVSKGDVVVQFETKDVDKKIDDAAKALRLQQLDLEEAELAHQQFLVTNGLDRQVAKRTLQAARQKFDNYENFDRQRSIDSAKQSVKRSAGYLDNAREELEQLRKMYEEDDLTEESEEIVLRRQKEAVENAEFSHESVVVSANRTIRQTVPRTDAQRKDELRRAELTFDSKVLKLTNERTRKAAEIEDKRTDYDEKREDLEKLRDQRRTLSLKAPVDGVVLHGQLTRGKIADKPSTLKTGSKVTASQVLVTVVGGSRMRVRMDVSENDVSKVSAGQSVVVIPTAAPDVRVEGKVHSVSSVPYAGTKYDAVVNIKPIKSLTLSVGMTCKVEVATTEAAKNPSAAKKVQEMPKTENAQKPNEKSTEKPNAKKTPPRRSKRNRSSKTDKSANSDA